MKIGILTASRTNNNGTDLQALAMQRIFESTGNKVEIINYKCAKLENSRKPFYPHTLKGFLHIPWKIHNHIMHEQFRNKFFTYSNVIYDATTVGTNDYDMIVVGSDQIWNLSITGNDLNFFLPFEKKEQKRYSYAASFGKTDIKKWEEKYRLSRYLRYFDGVSVREKSGVDALNKIGVQARFDLDPLLMLKREEWETYKGSIQYKKGYIFVYVVDRTHEAVDFAKAYGKKNNLDVIFYGNPIKPIKGVKVKRFSNIQDWISLVIDADLIVTNSYHCLSFAVLFHKAFSIFALSHAPQSNTRLSNLLGIIGVDDFSDGKIYDLNWKKVDEFINVQRKNSYSYILGMLTGE